MKWHLTAAVAAKVWQRESQRQFRTIIKLQHATIAGDVEALHDRRVAIRRLRVLLRALKSLARTASEAVSRRWRNFTRKLSPQRDADVWRALLMDLPEIPDAFRQEVLNRLGQKPCPLAELLQGDVWLRLIRDTQTLLEKARTILADPESAKPHRAFYRAWGQATIRAAERARSQELTQPEAAHKLRIACRRARYLAEFLALTAARHQSCRTWRKIGRHYQAAQDALGQTHDTDTLLEFLRTQRIDLPPAIRDTLLHHRTQGLANFRKAWKQL